MKKRRGLWIGCGLGAVLLLALAVCGGLRLSSNWADSMSAPQNYTQAEAIAWMSEQHEISVPDDARDVYCFRYGRDPHWYMAFSAELPACWQEAEKYAGVKKAAFRKWNPEHCPPALEAPAKRDKTFQADLWSPGKVSKGRHFNNQEEMPAPLRFVLVDEAAGRVYFVFGTQ